MFFLFFGKRFPLVGVAIGTALIVIGLLVTGSVLTARLEISGVVVLALSGYRAWTAWRRHGVGGLIRAKGETTPLR